MTAPDTAALALLRELEWHDKGISHDNKWLRFCPLCDQDRRDGHTPDCRLAAALSSASSPAGAEPIAAGGGKPDGVTVDG